jgi:hypothetical protein
MFQSWLDSVIVAIDDGTHSAVRDWFRSLPLYTGIVRQCR